MNESIIAPNPEDILVSIIIPVYNVEKYLSRCVDSVLLQSHQNIEVILVDDGSNDNSGTISDSLKEKDPRIQVIHKTNGGPSSARNAGMSSARGKYYLFCDSDDTVESTWAEKLLNTSIQYPKSLVVCGINNIYENDGSSDYSFVTEGIYDREKYYQLISPGITGSACIKIFDADIINTNHLRFDERVRFSEDVIFTLDYLKYVSSFYVVGEALYNYYHFEQKTRETISSNVTYQQMKYIYEKRLPYIAEIDKKEYKRTVFGNYWSRFNELSKRKDIIFKERMKEAKSILKDSVFQEYISEHGESMFDNYSLKLIKKGNAFGYFLFHKLAKLKKGLHMENKADE